MDAMNEIIAKQQKTVDVSMEERHLEEFKNTVKAMSDEEKCIVLKSISSDLLIDEIKRRMNSLEERDEAMRKLFNIQVDD